MIQPAANAKETALIAELRGFNGAMVAFSAGVDSTYLLAVAHEVLGDRVLAVTADSPSLARTSLEEARRFCSERGIRHAVVATDEFEREEYRANDGRRCFHCKAALMRAMNALAEATRTERGEQALLLGAIADDFDDVRPGLQAAAQAGAQWPLAKTGFSKQDVREQSRARNLQTWNRPAEPCLSSRLPYGEPVTLEALRMIEAAETVLKSFGFAECRARHHQVGGGRGKLCRIEVPDADLERVLAHRGDLITKIKAVGYANVTLDLAGLVSGGFNNLLSATERTTANGRA
jgi:uncharacterized protein